jgi:hypothetical protein
MCYSFLGCRGKHIGKYRQSCGHIPGRTLDIYIIYLKKRESNLAAGYCLVLRVADRPGISFFRASRKLSKFTYQMIATGNKITGTITNMAMIICHSMVIRSPTFKLNTRRLPWATAELLICRPLKIGILA